MKCDEKTKIVMLKGEKGDTYDDTELRTEIDTKLANATYTKYQEDDDYELPIHSIKDDEVSNVKTWSSDKINQELSSLSDNITEVSGDLSEANNIIDIIKNSFYTFSTSLSKSVFASVTAGQISFEVPVNSDFNNVLLNLKNIMGEAIYDMSIGYSYNYTGETFDDTDSYEAVKNMNFRLGRCRVIGNGTSALPFSIIIDWKCKTSPVTTNITNGVYFNFTLMLPIITE